MSKNKYWIILVSVLAGLALGYLFFSDSYEQAETAELHAGHETYTCSMHPQIRRDEPGKCPICGMDLVTVSSQDSDSNPSTVELSSSAIKLANVQTTMIGRRSPKKTLTLNGTILPDETAIRIQTAHVNGRVESLFVNTTGEQISKGQAIARLYAPDLILAQKELLQVASRKDLNPGLYRAAVSKLRSFELTQEQINQIESSGEVRDNITVQADYSGIVTEKHIDPGQHVMAGDPLYTLADLSRLWVVFEAYESDLSFINKGDTIEFSAAAIPGETFTGTISFIDPVVDPISRITRVRAEIRNRDDLFKPEMYVKGRITSQTPSPGDEIIVPKSAVLWTGERSVVYVKTADRDNAFQVREVLLGNDLGDSYVIRSGLSAGDIIVTNGTFAVDAAAQLAGKYSMMNLPENNTPKELPDQELTNQLLPALQQYLALKNALVASDEASAKRFVQALLEELPDPQTYENTEWYASLSMINSSAGNMADSKNIDEMRRNFINVSNEMVKWARLVPQTEGPLYIMYCPMANNNSGAVWVSNDETVENPYYGDLMLNCGEITETITKKNN